MISLIIYLVGIIISYIVFRKNSLKKNLGKRTWKNISWNFLCSIYSWVALLIFYIIAIINWIEEDSENYKPPKFL